MIKFILVLLLAIGAFVGLAACHLSLPWIATGVIVAVFLGCRAIK